MINLILKLLKDNIEGIFESSQPGKVKKKLWFVIFTRFHFLSHF